MADPDPSELDQLYRENARLVGLPDAWPSGWWLCTQLSRLSWLDSSRGSGHASGEHA
jgi:hypothetical protein